MFNSVTRTFIEGQLCYELEVNKFFTDPRNEQKLRRGLTLILDYNEDRNLVRIRGKETQIRNNLVDNIVSFEESQEALIYIKTISKKIRARKLLKFPKIFSKFSSDKNIRGGTLRYRSSEGTVSHPVLPQAEWRPPVSEIDMKSL